MARPLGLTQRGGSYQLRIVIPKDLRDVYEGRSDIRISLGKLDRALAYPLAHRLRAERESEFAQRRLELNPHEVTEVTPQLSKAIASEVYALVLRQDDAARDQPEIRAALMELAGLTSLDALTIGSKAKGRVETERDSLDGLSEGAAKVLSDLNRLTEAGAAVDLARRNLKAVKPVADQIARSMGMSVDWTSSSGREALKESLAAYRKACGDRSKRDLGEFVPTPQLEAVASSVLEQAATPTHKLSDVFDKWKASGDNPSAATIRKKQASVNHYVSLMQDAPIERLNKAMGVEFASALLGACKMQKTAKDHLDGVKSLLNFAVDKLGWLKVNEWAAQSIQVKKRNQRKPWPSEDLRKLVDSPLFKSYQLPTMPSAGGAAAYWVPLLGLYTGARQSELCQLRIEDLQDTPEGLVLYVLRDGGDHEDGTPGTTTKTEASNRRLPVHSDLIALGLKDYWRDMKEAGHKVLFPDIKRAPDRSAGEYFSDWFLIYRREQGIDRRWVDFHAFRHTAATRLTDAGVSDSVADYLTGHGGNGRGSAGRYKAMQEIGPALEKLRYPELMLQRVYPRTLSQVALR